MKPVAGFTTIPADIKLTPRHRGAPAVVVGNTLYASAVSGFDATSARDLSRQTRLAYRRVAEMLEKAGHSISSIVKIVEYVAVAVLEHYPEIAGVRDELIGPNKPAINTVIVTELSELGALIEIEVVSDVSAGVLRAAGGAVLAASTGVVHLPTILPIDDEGALLHPGDVAAQTHVIFERARRILSAVGVGLNQITMTIDHPIEAARSGYRASAAVRQDYLGPVYPASAGIVLPKLLHPEAMIQFEFFATRERPVVVNPGWSRYGALTYSPAVRAGDLLFIAGQSARDPADEQMRAPGDAAGQAEFIYAKSITIIEAAGGTARDMVRTFEYIPPRNLSAYDRVVESRKRMFPDLPIASSGIVCGSLLKRSMEIEIIGFAVLGRGGK